VRANKLVENPEMGISIAKSLTKQQISHITTCFSEFSDKIAPVFWSIFPYSKESINHFFVFKEKIHGI